MRWPDAVQQLLEARFEKYYNGRSVDMIAETQWENWEEELQQAENM